MATTGALEIAKATALSMMHNNPFHFWAAAFLLFTGLVALIAGVIGFIYVNSKR